VSNVADVYIVVVVVVIIVVAGLNTQRRQGPIQVVEDVAFLFLPSLFLRRLAWLRRRVRCVQRVVAACRRRLPLASSVAVVPPARFCRVVGVHCVVRMLRRRRVLHAAEQAQRQVQRRFILYVVVRQRAPVVQLLACVDEALVVDWDAMASLFTP